MLQLELVEGELGERSGLDAVVNATDTELNFAGGVDMLLAHFGGPDLVREAEALGPIDLGAAVCSGPGALPTRRVIHVAVTGYRVEDLSGPLRDGALSSESVLKDATRAALTLAEQHSCASIAFPALARAALGFPADEGARAMLEALWDYVLAHPRTCITRLDMVLRADETAPFAAARAALADREREAMEAQLRAQREAHEARERAEREERERRAQAEREEYERAERERAAREKAEWQRQDRERAERERIERERLERDRERAERERIERERAEWERVERERLERERAEWERAQREQAQLEAAARDLVARERAERERAAEASGALLGRGVRLSSRPAGSPPAADGVRARPSAPARPTIVEMRSDPSAVGAPPRASTPSAGSPQVPRRFVEEKTHIVREGADAAAPPAKPRSTARPTLVDQPIGSRPAPSATMAPSAPSTSGPVPAPRRPFVDEKTHVVRESAPSAPPRPLVEERAPSAKPLPAAGRPATRPVPAAGAPSRPARVGAGPLIRDDDDYSDVTEVPAELDAELIEDDGLPSDGPTRNRR